MRASGELRDEEGGDGGGMRTGFEGVKAGTVEGVEEGVPTRRVQADVVNGAGED